MRHEDLNNSMGIGKLVSAIGSTFLFYLRVASIIYAYMTYGLF